MGLLLGCGACFFLIGLLVAVIFYLLTLSRALALCSPRNRTMEPGMVWLNLVPLLNIAWMSVTVMKVAESLKNEFHSRRMDDGGSYGLILGMIYCGLNLVSIGFNFIGKIVPLVDLFVGLPLGLIAMACWIAYWVKIAGYSRELGERSRYDDYDDDDDDDYDDRPRRRRNRGDDDEEDDDDRRDRRRRRRRDDDDDF
jgi:hypothetical protein